MQVGHRDAAEHRADDAEEALVGAGQIDVVQMRAAVLDLVWCARRVMPDQATHVHGGINSRCRAARIG